MDPDRNYIVSCSIFIKCNKDAGYAIKFNPDRSLSINYGLCHGELVEGCISY
jgi:hypothetical protein